MTTINAYLTFDGNCEEAFEIYRQAIGGELSYLARFSEMLTDPGLSIPESEANKIMHVSLPIGETILMGSDRNDAFDEANFTQGTNFSLSLAPESKDESDRLFAALSEGGNVVMPMADTFWNAYFGMFVYKFGIQWIINQEMQSEGE